MHAELALLGKRSTRLTNLSARRSSMSFAFIVVLFFRFLAGFSAGSSSSVLLVNSCASWLETSVKWELRICLIESVMARRAEGYFMSRNRPAIFQSNYPFPIELTWNW